jgi:hypothetical protein
MRPRFQCGWADPEFMPPMSISNVIAKFRPRYAALTVRARPSLVIAALIFILTLGCDKISQKPDKATALILAPVEAQIKALNHRDAQAALAVMHPDAPGLARAREATEQVTATYDLIYMIQSLTVESADENEAKVRFSQITQKAAGPEFRNNRLVGIHTLRKYQGAWKIYSTQALKIEYLDK